MNQLIEVDIDYLYQPAGGVVMGHKSNAGRKKKIVGIFSNERVAVYRAVCVLFINLVTVCSLKSRQQFCSVTSRHMHCQKGGIF